MTRPPFDVDPLHTEPVRPACPHCGTEVDRPGPCIDDIGRGGSVWLWLAVAIVVAAVLLIVYLASSAASRPAAEPSSRLVTTQPLAGAPQEPAVTYGRTAGSSAGARPLGGAPLLAVAPEGVISPAVIGSALIGGRATWFCGAGSPCTRGYPAGSMAAAAGSELRFPGWRGSWVTVRHGGRSVRVQLVDVCRCPGSRVIDLYRLPFSKLAEPSVGIIDVEVEYGGTAPDIKLPETDTETQP